MSLKQNKKDYQDSTNELFLKFVKKEQEKKSKELKDKTLNNTKKVKTVDTVIKIYNYMNQLLDRILSNKMNILILSLGMAGLLFYTISGDQILNSPTSGTKINEVNIKVENLSEEFEVFGVPEEITVGLIGPSLDIYKTNFSKDYEVFADLGSIEEEGEYSLELQYRNFAETLDVMLLPSTINVSIAEKHEEMLELGYIFINEDELDSKYSVSVDSMDLDTVQVYASKPTLSRIDKIVACIDVSKKSEAFEQSAKIKAYDINGKVMDVDISPATVNVKCSVAAYSKSVVITPHYVGDVERGYGITGCSLNQTTVTIYGLEENIDEIETVYADINVDGLKDNTTISGVSLRKEKGINKFSIEHIEANLEIEKLITKTIENIPITILNNTNKYKVSFAGEGQKATLKVTGTESKINELSLSNVQATIDIDQLKVGTHKVNVEVACDDEYIELELLSSEMITINIERN